MSMSKSTVGFGVAVAIILAALVAIFMTDAPYLRGFWEGLLIGFLLTMFFGVLAISLNHLSRRGGAQTRAQAR